MIFSLLIIYVASMAEDGCVQGYLNLHLNLHPMVYFTRITFNGDLGIEIHSFGRLRENTLVYALNSSILVHIERRSCGRQWRKTPVYAIIYFMIVGIFYYKEAIST
jgi:hypothetical protein